MLSCTALACHPNRVNFLLRHISATHLRPTRCLHVQNVEVGCGRTGYSRRSARRHRTAAARTAPARSCRSHLPMRDGVVFIPARLPTGISNIVVSRMQPSTQESGHQVCRSRAPRRRTTASAPTVRPCGRPSGCWLNRERQAGVRSGRDGVPQQLAVLGHEPPAPHRLAIQSDPSSRCWCHDLYEILRT